MNQPIEKEPAGLRKAAAQEGLPTDEVMERLTPQEIKAEELKKVEEELADQQYDEYLESQRSYHDEYDQWYDDLYWGDEPFDDPYDPYDYSFGDDWD